MTGSSPTVEWWRRPSPQPSFGRGPAIHSDTTANGVAFWALMMFMAVLLLAPQFMFPALAPFRLALLAGGVAVVAHTLDRWTVGRPSNVRTREMKLAACLAGWAGLTVPFSYWPGGSVEVLTDLFLKSLVLFWLIANVVNSIWRLRHFAWGLTLMSIPITNTGLEHYLSGTFLSDGARIVGYEGSLTANPNDLALMLNLILPFTLALVGLTRRPAVRALLLGIVALNITAIIVTFSRGGFITLSVVLGITVARLLRTPKRPWGLALLAALLLSLPILPTSYGSRVATITDIDSDPTGSAQARWALTVAALRFVFTHPVVGAGIGGDIYALNEDIGTWNNVHNAYLEFAVDLGFPGLVFFLLLFAACLGSTSITCHKVGRHPAESDLAYLAKAIRLSLIAFGVAALFHPVAYHFYFYCLAGLAAACRIHLAQRASS